MDDIRVLIADDNASTRDMLIRCIASERDMRVVGEACNGAEAVSYIIQGDADVLILDMVMPELDGFAVMDRIRNLPRRPRVLVLTSLGRSDFIARSLALGVDDYMVKPFDPAILLERVRKLAQSKAKSSSAPIADAKPENMTRYISGMLLTSGIPAHLCGYQYLREAIRMAVVNPDRLHFMMQRLYPSIAESYCTTPSRVERSIRNAITTMWNRHTPEQLTRAFGRQAGVILLKPSNSEFIAMAAECVRLKTGM